VTHCEGDHCVTCSDEAVAVRVLRLHDDGLAEVEVGDGRTEEVSVALVDAAVGDTVLVHAKEAIGILP
jgi:hydrogenase maturation factor